MMKLMSCGRLVINKCFLLSIQLMFRIIYLSLAILSYACTLMLVGTSYYALDTARKISSPFMIIFS
jgi:hypothetical protein